MTRLANYSDELKRIFEPKVVEHSIALKRAEIDHKLGKKYNTEEHNIALAFLHFKDGSSNVLTAYSNDSVFTQKGYSGESLMINLGLIPNLYPELLASDRFGCDGRGQYHTEPKLLNYLTASPEVRKSPYITGTGFLPKSPFFRSVIEANRRLAEVMAGNLKPPTDLTHLLIATEIDCCKLCEKYAISLFEERFPKVKFYVKSFAKNVGKKIPPQYEHGTKINIISSEDVVSLRIASIAKWLVIWV